MQEQTFEMTARDLLEQTLIDEAAALQQTVRLYVWRAGLANGEAATAVAADIWQEVAVEALQHAERFQPESQLSYIFAVRSPYSASISEGIVCKTATFGIACGKGSETNFGIVGAVCRCATWFC